MRKILMLVFVVLFVFCAYAADFSTINEESMKAFFEFFPKCGVLQQGFLMGRVIQETYEQEMEKILIKYDLSIEQYNKFNERVMFAHALILQPKDDVTRRTAIMQGILFSEEELAVMEKYLNQFHEISENMAKDMMEEHEAFMVQQQTSE